MHPWELSRPVLALVLSLSFSACRGDEPGATAADAGDQATNTADASTRKPSDAGPDTGVTHDAASQAMHDAGKDVGAHEPMDAASDAGASTDAGRDAGDIDADSGSEDGGTDLSLFIHDDTALSGLDPATIDELKNGTATCTTTLLAPYANTVFPRGLPAPTFMWSGAADAAHLRLRYENQTNVEYETATAASAAGSLAIPQTAWDRITNRSESNALLATLTVKNGASLSRCSTRLRIAPGRLAGALYYDTYTAPGAAFARQGAIVRVKLADQTSSIYLQDSSPKNSIASTGPCISCHSLAADGSKLVAARHDYGGNGLTKVFSFETRVYPVTGNSPSPSATSSLPNATWGALYPDGSRVLTPGNPQCTNRAETFPRAPGNMPYVSGPSAAKVFDVATGAELPAPGLIGDAYMWMARFSPDGKQVVFNHAKPDGLGGTDRRELAIMDFDFATNTFSNLRVIASGLGPAPSESYAPQPVLYGTITESCVPALAGGSQTASLPSGACTGPCYPAWPSFTPDGRGVVFSLIDQPDFLSAMPGRSTESHAELWYVDVPTGMLVRLDNANQGNVAEDALQNYYPTVLPVAVGGYAWLFWTAKRTYGNRVFPEVPSTIDGSEISAAFAMQDGRNKRIWASALRLIPEGTPFPMGTDLSAPGFFLPGQTDSGNLRSTATLFACAPEPSGCRAGYECCSGFCAQPVASADPDDTSLGQCTSVVPNCSAFGDRCSTNGDCCGASASQPASACLGGFCAAIP